LDHFNTLDFSNQTDVEYISGECQFNRPITEAIDQYVFDSWQVEKIDLGSLTFLNNSSGRSGDHTFSLTQTVPKLGIEPIPSPPDINWTNLSSLITLDFGTSV
jgi:hypothetical protein